MLGRSVGILSFAASALQASAFLLPPAINDEAGALSITPGALNAKQTALRLPCSECAFSPKQQEENIEDFDDEEETFWIQGGANSVVVNFTIPEDGQTLQVNGETIYPLGVTNLLGGRVYVNQVASSASIEDIESGKAKTTPLEVTGSGVSVLEEEVVSPEGHMLVPIKHTIFELESQPVSLDDISIKILKSDKGELFIAQVEVIVGTKPRIEDFFGPPPPPEEMDDDFPFPPPMRPHGPPPPPEEMPDDMAEEFLPFPPPPFHHKGPPRPPSEQKECKMLPASLCKFRNMIEDKIMGMREGGFRGFRRPGCHGRKGKHGFRPHGGKVPGHIKPHFLRPGPDGPPRHHHGRPHHMRPHGMHHHGEHLRHHFMHSFTRGLAAVLIPTMAGVAVGMTVSLVGLCVGRLIGFLWIKFYRGGRRGYQPVRLEDDTPADAEIEKVVLVEEEVEPLPKYEEAPAYVEEVKEEK